MKEKSVSGTREWASHNLNIYTGCQHECKYCYASANAYRFKRIGKGEWSDPVLNEKKFRARIKPLTYPERYMYPTTHDLTLEQMPRHVIYIKDILDTGSHLLIVSKPDPYCIEYLIDLLKNWVVKDKILFRFTIGSANNEVLKWWEPNAPSFEDRLESLKLAHARGFQTSISCEPMLDNKIKIVIAKVEPYVTDAIWVGKANNLSARLKLNGHTSLEDKDKLLELMAWQSDKNIKILYDIYKDYPKVKWKESIKDVVGLKRPDDIGLDV